ncbi:MAG: hypothetical protein JSW06_00615 [Thermoplasmatales archaeon]|nr:MAG: hypothetical protein JSW06_00615 [Thermoplasmatales archaeon]
MSVEKRVIVLLIIILLSFFSGCTLFDSPEFSLISLVVDDDEGFVGMSISFNISDKTTLKLFGPDRDVLFLDDYYRGMHNVMAYLDEYRKTPSSGRYNIQAYDKNENLIFENELFFKGQNLSILEVNENWWLEDGKYSLVGLNLTIMNYGDLPVYPYIADVQIDNKESSGLFLPTVILPHQSRNVYCFIYIDDILSKKSQLKISLKNNEENIIANTSHTIFLSENISELTYNWRYLGNNNLVLPDIEFLYKYYSNLERLVLDDYAAYVFDLYHDQYMDLVVKRLLSLTDASGDVGKINFVASFIQNLGYAEDDPNDPTCEYPRYPVEMLKDSQGDCEDKAILAGSILDSMGFNISLLKLPNHMVVGVHLDESESIFDYYIEEYYFLETTSTGWILGKIPPEYKNLSNVTIYPISTRPLLIHSWKNATRFSGSDESDYVKLKIIVENLGRESASNFKILGAFYSQNNILNQEEILIPSLAAGNKKIVDLKLNVPQGISTTLKTQIHLNNKIVNEKESNSSFP